MSADSQERPALGSRDNYWGDQSYAAEPDATEDDDSHREIPGVSWESYVAGNVLRQNPDVKLFCPVCYYELPDEDEGADSIAVELSDPEDYVAPSNVEREADDGTVFVERRYSDHRRHRHCPRCSHIVWGGKLGDVSTESFLTVVDEVLGALDLPPSQRQRLRSNAQSRKARGLSDESNMETLLHELRYGTDVNAE